MAQGNRNGKPDRALPARGANWPYGPSDELTRDDLARELIGVCMQALKTYGLDDRRLARLAAAVAKERLPGVSRSALLLSDIERLSKTINKWGEDPHYLDATGRPGVLPIAGEKHCFAELARAFFPKRNCLDVVTLGCNTHVMERVGLKKVAMINNAVLFPGNHSLTLAHTVRTVRRFLGTAHYNRHVSADAVFGLPDRAADVDISAQDFVEFVSMIRPQISGLVEMTDRWLIQRSRLRRNRLKRKRLAGIQVFVFRE